MQKILIIGDSFVADWKTKYPRAQGWVNLLSQKFQITNLAQAGVGEFKILKQIQQAKLSEPLCAYHSVIVCHTSPYRVHTRQHPIHHCDTLHKNADLIIHDIHYHANKLTNWFNLPLWSAQRFFLDHYDIDYQERIYDMLKNEIHKELGNANCLLIKNSINQTTTESVSLKILDITAIEAECPGLYNHLSLDGNRRVFDLMCKNLYA